MGRLRYGVVVAALLVAGACGGDDDGDAADGGDGGTGTTAAAVVTTTTGAAAEGDTEGTTTTLVEGATTTVAEDASTTTAPLGPPTLDESSTVSTVGLDSVTFGMSLADAQAAAGTVFVPEGPVGRCTVYVPEQAPAGVRFTIVDGTVERVDVREATVRTRSGLGVGSPVADVLARFGAQAQVAPRPDGSGDDIVFVPQDEADAAFRVIFETDGSVVTAYRSGRIPIVAPSVPCAALQLPEVPSSSTPP